MITIPLKSLGKFHWKLVIYEHAMLCIIYFQKRKAKNFFHKSTVCKIFEKSSSWKKEILAKRHCQMNARFNWFRFRILCIRNQFAGKKINLFGICSKTEGPKRKSMAHIFLGYFCRGKLSKIAPSGNGSFFFKSVMQKWFNITSILYSFHDLLFRGEASTFFFGRKHFHSKANPFVHFQFAKIGKS